MLNVRNIAFEKNLKNLNEENSFSIGVDLLGNTNDIYEQIFYFELL